MLGVGPTTLPCQKTQVKETEARENTTGQGGEAIQQQRSEGVAGFMTDSGESPREAEALTAEALRPKTVTRIGYWNVRTLYQAGKLATLRKEFDSYKLDLLGISEVRWLGSNKKLLKEDTKLKSHTLIFSGRKDGRHEEGVGLLMSRELSKTLIEWKPISPRLLKARFNSKYTKLSVIVCYAPTNTADDDQKDEFYEQLNATTQEVSSHDMLVIIGDMNARPGSDNTGKTRIMGNEGYGTINENGTRLCNFCEDNNLKIGGTLFPHKSIHKITWISPDDHTKAQLDHILINCKWKSSLQDVRVHRGADIASDHFLCIASVKLKLRKTRNGQTRGRRIDSQRLRDKETKEKFKVELRNRFQALEDDQNVSLEEFNRIFIESGTKILGYQRKKKEEWIKEPTWSKIEERKEMKQRIISTKSERIKTQLSNQYTQIDKEVKRMTKEDKNDFMEELAERSEDAAKRGDSRTLYKITKTLNGSGQQSSNVPVKDKQGNDIPNEKEQAKRWCEHFEEILNRPNPTNVAEILEADVDLDINTEPPSEVEVKASIAAMKSGKAGGIDGVTADMLKTEEHTTPKLLTQIYNVIWSDEAAPPEWKTGLIAKIPKKGDLSDCNNWRGITLLSLTSKVFSRIIFKRLLEALQEVLRQEQAGFLPGRSCPEHIFTLRQIFEQCNEWNTELYANFIDFEKAFDSIHRESLWKILRHYGIPKKIVDIIKMLYSDFSAKVICGNELTDTFKVNTGVKQGCVLSPFLFLLGIDWIMKRTTEGPKKGIRFTLFRCLEDLDFADDIVLLAHRHTDMQAKTTTLSEEASSIGLKVSQKKTKHIRVKAKSNQPIKVYQDDVEDVEDFTYLGSRISKGGDSKSEITSRISKAKHSFHLLKKTWKSKKIKLKTKLRIFKSNVLSVLLYGCESWKITGGICNKLDAFHRTCLRRILGIHWPKIITNQALYRKTSTMPIHMVIKERRWNWIGHLLRRPYNHIGRIALRWTPDGKRKRGRPKETWRRTVEKEMKGQGWTWGYLERQAQDRRQWFSLVDAFCAVEEDFGNMSDDSTDTHHED